MDSQQQQEDWMNRKWRPAMGWTYMVICILDFALFPIFWSIGLALTHQTITQWDPLTLRGAGLFHMAMGAILGIAAWSRGQEKIAMETKPTPIVMPSLNTKPVLSAPNEDPQFRNTRND